MFLLVRKLIMARLDRAERQLGQSVDYLRYMFDKSPRAFFKFARFLPLATYRRKLPLDACFVAQLVATLKQDCGACVQIGLKLAADQGVDARVIQAALHGDLEALPPDLADVYRFAQAVVDATYDEEPLRRKLIDRYGEEAFVELALAIATAQVFPVTKRALGYAKSCSVVGISRPEALVAH